MADSNNRVLANVEYNLLANTVNVAWRDDKQNIHRGAYPVNEAGEVDDRVKTILGRTLHDILGEAGANAQRELDGLRAVNELLNNTLQDVANERDRLSNDRQLIDQYVNQLHSENENLKSTLRGVVTERDSLVSQRQMIDKYVNQLNAENESLKSAIAIKKLD